MYDKDILSESVILKWAAKPLKHRFSCLTDKFLGELSEVAQPMVEWLKGGRGEGVRRRTAEPSDQEEDTIDLGNPIPEENEENENEEKDDDKEEEEDDDKAEDDDEEEEK